MKIIVHDFCGHAFTLSLACELSKVGHEVHYVYFASEPGPKGNFAAKKLLERPPTIHPVAIDGQYRKDAFVSRRFFDIEYGKKVKKVIAQIGADVLLSGNTPTEVQSYVMDSCRRSGTAFVYWMQDFYSVAASKLLKRKLGLLGDFIGAYYRHLDKKHLRNSDRVVLITEDFLPLASAWSGRDSNIDVIENWGVIEDIALGQHDNTWSRSVGAHDTFNYIYSGTLGLKHNPELLAKLAQRVRGTAKVFVISQGASVPFLTKRKAELELDNLEILPLQPFEELPNILASADVVVATIEPDAGTFSVPSKILSYLCAGRPILLAANHDNLAVKTVLKAKAGVVVEPTDEQQFLEEAVAMRKNSMLSQLGKNGRTYAEKSFDAAEIRKRFEVCFASAMKSMEKNK